MNSYFGARRSYEIVCNNWHFSTTLKGSILCDVLLSKTCQTFTLLEHVSLINKGKFYDWNDFSQFAKQVNVKMLCKCIFHENNPIKYGGCIFSNFQQVIIYLFWK